MTIFPTMYNNNVTSITSKINDNSDRLKELKQEVDKINDRVNRLENEFKYIDDEINVLKEEVDNREAKILDTVKENIDYVIDDIEKSEKKYNELLDDVYSNLTKKITIAENRANVDISNINDTLNKMVIGMLLYCIFMPILLYLFVSL